MSTANDDHPPTSDEPAASRSGPRFPSWLKWALLAALGVLVVGYGLVFLYAKVLNDPEDALDQSDLEDALAADEPASEPGDESSAGQPPAATDAPGPTTASSTAPGATTATPPPAAAAGTWVATDASELGYRVKEILFNLDTEGVGRTNDVDGTIAIDGTQVVDGEFVVDVATITSDDSRRDGQFRGRIMSTDEFPEATFVLTEPIELGTEPAEGTAVTATATGELTLRGVTNPVTFDVEARLENGRIGVLGSIPIVFADYGIDNPSTAGITTEDNGLLEFVLVFEPA